MFAEFNCQIKMQERCSENTNNTNLQNINLRKLT